MVLGAPLVSLRGFASTRPPLLVFTLCLTAFALTTLWLAYFVRTEKQLQNADVHSNWKSLLDYLGTQELCIQHAGDALGKVDQHATVANETNDWLNVSVTVLATVVLPNVPANLSYVQGYVSVAGWKSVCPTANPFQETQIGIFFDLGQGVQNRSEGQEICVTLTGPKSLLPMAGSPSACVSPSHRPQGNVASFTTRLSPPALGERVDSWCNDGSGAVRFTYKINPENSVVLSISDRSIINLHLVHTSYFLFVMAITLICYAVIRGKPKNKILTMDKVPLDP